MKRATDISSKHSELPVKEDPWREYAEVQAVFSATQAEVDERAALAGKFWMPFGSRETWYSYDKTKAWWWNGSATGPRKLM